MRGLLVIVGLASGCRYRFDVQPAITTDASPDTDADPAVLGWTYASASAYTTCGVYLGIAYCWGKGTSFEIGDGTAMDRATPTPIALPAGTVTAIAQGEGHGCAIVDAVAYCWGTAPPGDGSSMSTRPVQVSTLPTPVTSISCGDRFTCATAAGNVYCWGNDTGGALGNGPSMLTLPTPTQVALPAQAVSVDAGNDHAMALLVDGSVWGWGHSDSGALGTGSLVLDIAETPVKSLVTDTQPSIAGWHACAIVGGGAQCWGSGPDGELGDGLAMDSATPVMVSGMTSNVTTLMTGGGPEVRDATCAVVAGEAWCWGNGTSGKLGSGRTDNELVPVRVQGLPADTAQLALGFAHTCARSTTGLLRCWGQGSSGQLGDGASASSMTPVVVAVP